MRHFRGFAAAAILLSVVITGVSPVDAAPESQMTWAVHTTLVLRWFDPAGMTAPYEDVRLKNK